MPARWQSSQRPLFVRTVWVAGRRHAVLSRDDPLLHCSRRPVSSPCTSNISNRTSSCQHSSCQLEDCLGKLRLALRPESYQVKFDESIFPIRQGTVESSSCFHHEDSDSPSEEELPCHRLPLLGKYPKVYSVDGGDPGSTILPDIQLNALSERVLQWLDLSGKGLRVSTAKVVHERKHTINVKRPHTATRRRELPTRSLSVDLLADMKLSARRLNARSKHKKVKEIITSDSSETEDYQVIRLPEESSSVHDFELPDHPPCLTLAPNKPKLHIFMPSLEDSETESYLEEDQY